VGDHRGRDWHPGRILVKKSEKGNGFEVGMKGRGGVLTLMSTYKFIEKNKILEREGPSDQLKLPQKGSVSIGKEAT